MNEYVKSIYDTAVGFRNAILLADKRSLPATLKLFPSGACGDASLLLGEYLFSLGFGEFEYVVGVRSERSHAWLEMNDMIIDITSDQFEEVEEPVIVTTKRTWHSQFSVEDKNPAKIDIYDQSSQQELRHALDIIKQLL
jgi:hypothetical protein